jgi:hypothetical protein
MTRRIISAIAIAGLITAVALPAVPCTAQERTAPPCCCPETAPTQACAAACDNQADVTLDQAALAPAPHDRLSMPSGVVSALWGMCDGTRTFRGHVVIARAPDPVPRQYLRVHNLRL